METTTVKPRTWTIVMGVGLVISAILVAGIYAWRSTPHPFPPWPDYAPHEGYAYCARLGDLAQRRSALHTLLASLAALLGLCAIIVGNLVEPPSPQEAERRWVRNPGLLLLNVGLLLLVGSHYEFSRADAASFTAASAAIAQADAARARAPTTPPTPPDAQDREAYVTCALARAAWLKSRVDSSALVQSEISNRSNSILGPSRTTPSGTHEEQPVAPPSNS